MQSGLPRLSVCVVTYNHEKYIAQALDSFLAQQTNFPFVVLVGDDASTDGTADIVRRYAEKYPDIIKPVLHKKNIGAASNSIDLFNRVKTEYVAICDGDDFWTNPHKLQKQVDFLEANRDCAVCFHPVKVFFEGVIGKEFIFPNKLAHPYVYGGQPLTVRDIAAENFIQSSSVVYRWRFPSGLPEWYTPDVMPGDWCMMILHADVGTIGFIDDCMAVYRRHAEGMWWKTSHAVQEHYRKYGLATLHIFKCLDAFFAGKYNRALRPTMRAILGNLIVAYQAVGDRAALAKLKLYITTDLKNFEFTCDPFSTIEVAKVRIKLLVKNMLGQGFASRLKALLR